MDGEQLEELRLTLAEHQAGVDLKICALVAAASHYRRATVCNPFPPEFGAAPADRDFEALRACLEALPSVTALRGHTLAQLSTQQQLLLRWLVLHPKRPAGGITHTSIEQLRRKLPSFTGWLSDVVHNPSLRPTAILQLQPFTQAEAEGKVIAFHGTHLENVHSILHLGLLNASGTRLERTGAAFGKGIYFSTELTVAFAFCHPGPAWRLSTLGARQRCIFVCGIDREHARLDGDSKTPEKYLVVDRPDAVTLYYAFLYSDDAEGQWDAAQPHAAAAAAGAAAPGGGGHAAHAPVQPAAQQAQRPMLLPLLVGAYVLWLVYVGLRDNWHIVRRLCWRHFGVRLP